MVIYKKPLQFIIAALFSVMPIIANANPTVDSVATTTEQTAKEAHVEHTDEKKDLKTEIKEFINHHLLDSHDFHLFSYTDDAGVDHHIGFPLPVILWDNGLQVFMSSEFHHGEAVAQSNGNYYKLYHGKIYKTDAKGTINESEVKGHHKVSNEKPFDLSITKSVFMMLLVSSRLCVAFFVFFEGSGNFLKTIFLALALQAL